MKTAVILVVAALIGLNIYQLIDRSDLRIALSHQSASLQAHAEAKAKPDRELAERLGQEKAGLLKRIAGLEKELSKAEEAENPETATVAPKANPMKAMAEMMDNPAMKDMMVAQQKASLDIMFEGLYGKLNLAPEELEHFKGLLTDLQMVNVESGLKLMADELTGPEREALFKKMKEDQDSARARIKEFLNDESDVAYYEFYSNTLNERMTTSGLNKSLEEKGMPLAPEQEESLVQLMYDERQKIDYENDYSDQYNFDPTTLSEASLARYFEQQTALENNITSATGSILTPEQQVVFEENQRQTRAMQEMGLRMAQQMFNGDQ